jgi:hypothetical protein
VDDDECCADCDGAVVLVGVSLVPSNADCRNARKAADLCDMLALGAPPGTQAVIVEQLAKLGRLCCGAGGDHDVDAAKLSARLQRQAVWS